MKQLGTELDREVSTHIPQISSDYRYCQTLSRLMEMIHMMLYEEESKGLDDPRGYIEDGPRAVT